MTIFKKWLLNVSPRLYYFLRNRIQYGRRVVSGEITQIQQLSDEVSTFDDAFSFANTHIKSYQIHTEIKSLISLIQQKQSRTYVEIGTAHGGTHFLIRKLCKSIKLSVAIDTDIRNQFLIDRLTQTESSHYILGFSNHPNTIKKMNSILNGTQTVDVLFIDGDHSYQGVKSDFEHYQSLVRPGGLIVFHDIVEDWKQRFGRNTNKYTGGVPRFFSEIKDTYEHYSFVEDTEQDGFGIGVIVQAV